MSELLNVLNSVYSVGYRLGWKHHADEVPLLGTGPSEPSENAELQDPDKWLDEVHEGIDLSNIVFARLKEESYMGEDYTSSDLHYVPHDDGELDGYLRQYLHAELDLGSAGHGRRISKVESDPAAYIEALEEELRELKSERSERIRKLEKENEALRASHPNAEVDGDEDWELDLSDPDHEVSATLDGDHVFDRAVIEFNTEVNAVAGEKGKLEANIDIEELKLVSDS